uniref:Abhydrolase domain containing 14B n=1 Tax=Equus caballus TaxID=9796 RepID=A0A9L0SAK5_HORSE
MDLPWLVATRGRPGAGPGPCSQATSPLPRPSPFPVSPPRAPSAVSTRLSAVCASPRRSPGLGRSKEAAAPAPIGELVPSSFLGAVVDALDLGPPVVISPSLSGMYSLPFLTAPGSQVRGYVPVAPICTDKIRAADYASVKTSALIVYGDQDPMGQTSFEHLKQLPNHRVLVMEGAGHPCYLDKPEEWHTGLLAFLQGL